MTNPFRLPPVDDLLKQNPFRQPDAVPDEYVQRLHKQYAYDKGRTLAKNAADKAEGERIGAMQYLEAASQAPETVAAGVPGAKLLISGARAALEGRPMADVQKEVNAETSDVPYASAIGRAAGGLAVMPLLPANPVAGGAVLGGAEGLLNNEDAPLAVGRRLSRAASGAAVGAAAGKAAEFAGSAAQKVGAATGATDFVGRQLRRFAPTAAVGEAMGTQGAANRIAARNAEIPAALGMDGAGTVEQQLLEHEAETTKNAAKLFGDARKDTQVIDDPQVNAILENPAIQKALAWAKSVRKLAGGKVPTVASGGAEELGAALPSLAEDGLPDDYGEVAQAVGNAVRTASGKLKSGQSLAKVPDAELAKEYARLIQSQGADNVFIGSVEDHPDFAASRELLGGGHVEDARGMMSGAQNQAHGFAKAQAEQRQRGIQALEAELEKRGLSSDDALWIADRYGTRAASALSGEAPAATTREALDPELLHLMKQHVQDVASNPAVAPGEGGLSVQEVNAIKESGALNTLMNRLHKLSPAYAKADEYFSQRLAEQQGIEKAAALAGRPIKQAISGAETQSPEALEAWANEPLTWDNPRPDLAALRRRGISTGGRAAMADVVNETPLAKGTPGVLASPILQPSTPAAAARRELLSGDRADALSEAIRKMAAQSNRDEAAQASRPLLKRVFGRSMAAPDYLSSPEGQDALNALAAKLGTSPADAAAQIGRYRAGSKTLQDGGDVAIRALLSGLLNGVGGTP